MANEPTTDLSALLELKQRETTDDDDDSKENDTENETLNNLYYDGDEEEEKEKEKPTRKSKNKKGKIDTFVVMSEDEEEYTEAEKLLAERLLHIPQYNAMRLLIEAQRQMTSALLLPRPKVPIFKGDPLDYNLFTMAFDIRIVPHTSNDIDRLYYLYEHLEGEPRDLIGGCLFMKGDVGYHSARELLDKEYGDTIKVATAYMNKLSAWPNVKSEDAQSMKELSFLLMKCYHVMQSISEMTVLNHIPNLQHVIRKLPEDLQEKWCEQVVEQRLLNRIPTFKDIVDFVKSASDVLNDPAFGIKAMSNDHNSTQTKPSDEQQSSFSLQVSVVKNCMMCGQDHDLDICNKFLSRTPTERRQIVHDKKLCFGCYGLNHISRNCQKKRTCQRCNKPHPTAMHIENFNATDWKYKTAAESIDNPVISRMTVTQEESMNLPASTVQVRNDNDGPHKGKRQYPASLHDNATCTSEPRDRTLVISNRNRKHKLSDTVPDRNRPDRKTLKTWEMKKTHNAINNFRYNDNGEIRHLHTDYDVEAQHETQVRKYQDIHNDSMSTKAATDYG